MSDKYPKRRGERYTEQFAVRLEPELYEELRRLGKQTGLDVPEAVRMALRALVKDLAEQAEAS